MKQRRYPHSRHLLLAGALSATGQATAIAFTLWTNPFTTFAFMTFGAAMILAGMAIFALVVFKDVRARTESVKERSFSSGEFIFRQGDAGDAVFVVTAGEVGVIHGDPEQGILIARLGKGEYFGEMALLTDAPRSASVRALTDVTALIIGRDDFHALFSGVPAFQRSVLAAMKQRQPARTPNG